MFVRGADPLRIGFVRRTRLRSLLPESCRVGPLQRTHPTRLRAGRGRRTPRYPAPATQTANGFVWRRRFRRGRVRSALVGRDCDVGLATETACRTRPTEIAQTANGFVWRRRGARCSARLGSFGAIGFVRRPCRCAPHAAFPPGVKTACGARPTRLSRSPMASFGAAEFVRGHRVRSARAASFGASSFVGRRRVRSARRRGIAGAVTSELPNCQRARAAWGNPPPLPSRAMADTSRPFPVNPPQTPDTPHRRVRRVVSAAIVGPSGRVPLASCPLCHRGEATLPSDSASPTSPLKGRTRRAVFPR